MEPVRLVGGRLVGDGLPPYVIAELGANHNGDMRVARRLVDEAASAGADAVKFQSWTADSLISSAEYERHTTYADSKRHFGSLREMVARYQLTIDQHEEMADYCRHVGIDFLSTPFSREEVDLLDRLDVPAFKVASMDVNHLPLLEYVASKGRPVLLSTGMATLAEIDRAARVLRSCGAQGIVLLHCVSIYPPEPTSVNLRNIAGLSQVLGLPVGFSDHTLGSSTSIAAVALGACLIEKHFTLDKNMDGWDHAISADPAELRELITGVRVAYDSLGSPQRIVGPAELEKRRQFRRRIVMARPVASGSVLALEDLAFKRPGTGIGPDEARYVVGRRVNVDLCEDAELEWGHLG